MCRKIWLLAILLSFAMPSLAWADDDDKDDDDGDRRPAATDHWSTSRINEFFKNEPTVQELQKAALRFYRVNPRRVRGLRRAAANKAWLPTIKGTFAGDYYQNTRQLDIAQYRTAYTWPWEEESRVDTRYTFSVSATWNLSKLIFNAEELDVLSLVGIQDGVLKEITRLYFIRRRLQISLLVNPPKDRMSRIMLALRLRELTGLIDAMTNGYLTKALLRARRRHTRK